jgi:hypothetical protein
MCRALRRQSADLQDVWAIVTNFYCSAPISKGARDATYAISFPVAATVLAALHSKVVCRYAAAFGQFGPDSLLPSRRGIGVLDTAWQDIDGG